MTVTHIAILPKYCESCKRDFIFERYIKKYKLFGIEERPLPVYYCLRCFRQILKEVIALKEGEHDDNDKGN